jgi:hypothetical protein
VRKAVNNQELDTSVLPWNTSTRSLWSLRDMVKFIAKHLIDALNSLNELENYGTIFSAGRAAPALVSVDELETVVRGRITYCRRQFVEIELGAAVDRIDNQVLPVLKDGLLSWQRVQAEAKIIRELVDNDLWKRRFAYIPVAKADIQDNMGHSWELVWKQFPSVKEDAEEAVNCYGLGCNTACVFHLMRVAEYGLRALARERKIKLPKGRPLEWADWQDLIAALGKKVDLIANKKRGPARDVALEFYRAAVGQFQAFKDVYRNNVMHTRDCYDEHKAASVLSHVREFMTILSGKIDENPKKSIRWGIR